MIMQKRLLFFLFCAWSMTFMLQGCMAQNHHGSMSNSNRSYRQKQRLKAQYGVLLNNYAEMTLIKINAIISPQSGKDLQYEVDLDNISVPYDNVLSVDVRFDWSARNWPSVPYGTCTMVGTLYLYLPSSKIDMTKSKFFPNDYNQHLIDVSSKSQLKKILNGVVVTQ